MKSTKNLPNKFPLALIISTVAIAYLGFNLGHTSARIDSIYHNQAVIASALSTLLDLHQCR